MMRNGFNIKGSILMGFAILLSSCAIYAPTDYLLQDDLPATFSIDSENVLRCEDLGWKSFQSPELHALIEEALTKSPTIQQAWARLTQAEAVSRQAGAARFPSLDANASVTSTRESITKTTVETYSVGLSAAYEIDLWGRIQSQAEAAVLDREASREQLNTVQITLSSQVARSWAGIVVQRLQTDLLRQQLETNQTTLELIELRFRKSLATALDVYQQRQAVSAIEARIPSAELSEKLLLNQLAVLLGRSPSKPLELAVKNLPALGKIPVIGIPADVLAHRPDVRRAGLRLRAADWRVSSARADRLPAIRLTASADYQNAKSAELFDDWFANLVGGVTGPIFEGGHRKAEVKRTRAVVDERLADYRETVLQAIREVEDALISEEKQREHVMALEWNLELSRNAYREALSRYRSGLIDYLPVLVERVRLQTLEYDHIEAKLSLFQTRIELYQALGGFPLGRGCSEAPSYSPPRRGARRAGWVWCKRGLT